LASNKKIQGLKLEKKRYYLNRDFGSFRADLLSYARTYFSNNIQDFSDPSVGGMFIDLAAYVGDVMSFYMDHQYRELFPDTAVEEKNIERHAKAAGIKLEGPSAANVMVKFYIEVDTQLTSVTTVPIPSQLPIIQLGTVVVSDTGVPFDLTEDLDFSETDLNNVPLYKQRVGEVAADGTASTYILYREGLCISGFTETSSFSIPNTSVPFRTITLGKQNVTEIMSVKDSSGNVYYEVDSLASDTVFKVIENINNDSKQVRSQLQLTPAPYRFIREQTATSKITTIRFGSGDASTLDDDIIPDPSALALPLYGKTSLSRFTIDPSNLLKTQTLGISPRDTNITVEYRHSGGILHNVGSNSINSISVLRIKFNESIPIDKQIMIRASIDVKNDMPAAGGEDPLTLEEVKAIIPSARNQQARIVTQQDLLARIYTLPANLGRVFRAAVYPDPGTTLTNRIYIISRNSDRKLITAPDTLKKNLKVYLNEYRLISDAYDIVDAKIINIGINFRVVVDSISNKHIVLSNIVKKLVEFLNQDNIHIGQPIIVGLIQNVIFSVDGVITISRLKFTNLTSTVEEREYSTEIFDIDYNTRKGMIIPPVGSILELRYPEFDIIGGVE
jgi:hypothetical protein